MGGKEIQDKDSLCVRRPFRDKNFDKLGSKFKVEAKFSKEGSHCCEMRQYIKELSDNSKGQWREDTDENGAYGHRSNKADQSYPDFYYDIDASGEKASNQKSGQYYEAGDNPRTAPRKTIVFLVSIIDTCNKNKVVAAKRFVKLGWECE